MFIEVQIILTFYIDSIMYLEFTLETVIFIKSTKIDIHEK